jgi:hypothetical protein
MQSCSRNIISKEEVRISVEIGRASSGRALHVRDAARPRDSSLCHWGGRLLCSGAGVRWAKLGLPCLALSYTRPVLGERSSLGRAAVSVGPFGHACAPLYASEHAKQRTLGTEPTGRRSILTPHLVHRLTLNTKATDSRTHAKQPLPVYLIHTHVY